MDVFTRFKQAIKIRDVLLDNEVFQLHYRVTAIMLLACAALVASKQHFGDPIDCITRDDVPNKIMDTYCWIHSTFTLPDACNKTVGLEVAHPCVDKSDTSNREERVYHKYYQWVYFVLFFQACGFYTPHLIWKSWEGQLMKELTVSLELKNPLDSTKQPQKKSVKRVGEYFMKHFDKLIVENRSEMKLRDNSKKKRSPRHHEYFTSFTICETMNFLNVIIQIYMVDSFLGGTFTTFGLDVLDYVNMEQGDRVDPMVRVFPRMTKCTFHRFGSSGDVQRYDSLCILPLNILNEKIYIVMWFWFVFLAALTGVWLVYRLLTITKSDVRYKVLQRRANLANRNRLSYLVAKHLEPGDWFVLSMICKNMDSRWFKMLVDDLYWRCSEKRKSEEEKLRGFRSHSGKEQVVDQHSDDFSDENASSGGEDNDEADEDADQNGQDTGDLKEIAVIKT